jgi:hypothetical protein
MGRKLSAFEKELYQRIDEVMHYVWDPIGVSGVPQARDEYDAYLPQIFGMLLESKGAEELSDYLLKIEEERMCLTPDTKTAKEVVGVLLDWVEVLRRKHPS